MTSTTPGALRALDDLETKAKALLRSIDDARQAILGDPEPLVAEIPDHLRQGRCIYPPTPVARLRSSTTPEPLRTPAEIAAWVDKAQDGDGRLPWVRFPGSPRWRQIDAHAAPDPDNGRHEWALHYTAPDGVQVELVEAHTTLPALTAAEFDLACEAEQRLLEVTELHRERALDFGPDDGPKAA